MENKSLLPNGKTNVPEFYEGARRDDAIHQQFMEDLCRAYEVAASDPKNPSLRWVPKSLEQRFVRPSYHGLTVPNRLNVFVGVHCRDSKGNTHSDVYCVPTLWKDPTTIDEAQLRGFPVETRGSEHTFESFLLGLSSEEAVSTAQVFRGLSLIPMPAIRGDYETHYVVHVQSRDGKYANAQIHEGKLTYPIWGGNAFEVVPLTKGEDGMFYDFRARDISRMTLDEMRETPVFRGNIIVASIPQKPDYNISQIISSSSGIPPRKSGSSSNTTRGSTNGGFFGGYGSYGMPDSPQTLSAPPSPPAQSSPTTRISEITGAKGHEYRIPTQRSSLDFDSQQIVPIFHLKLLAVSEEIDPKQLVPLLGN